MKYEEIEEQIWEYCNRDCLAMQKGICPFRMMQGCQRFLSICKRHISSIFTPLIDYTSRYATIFTNCDIPSSVNVAVIFSARYFLPCI